MKMTKAGHRHVRPAFSSLTNHREQIPHSSKVLFTEYPQATHIKMQLSPQGKLQNWPMHKPMFVTSTALPLRHASRDKCATQGILHCGMNCQDSESQYRSSRQVGLHLVADWGVRFEAEIVLVRISVTE
jgi:hypothetical protein